MFHYNFNIQICGTGHDAEEAWNDAVEGFTLDPGGVPEPNDYTCEPDENSDDIGDHEIDKQIGFIED